MRYHFIFLHSEGCGVWYRVVSMPCMDLFALQSREYQYSVLPRGAPVMSIEASGTDSWRRYAHAPFGICNTFGLSAPAELIYEHFGFSVPNLTARAQQTIAFYTVSSSGSGNDHPVAPSLLDTPVFPTIPAVHHA